MNHMHYIWQKAALLASQYPEGMKYRREDGTALSITPKLIVLWDADGNNSAHVDIEQQEVICMSCDPCDIEDWITLRLQATTYENLIKQAEKDGNSYFEWCSNLASQVAATGRLALGESLRVQPQGRNDNSDAAESPVLYLR
jgi:hypothetical protein